MNNQDNNTGAFVISLDYELFWGVWAVATQETYGANITGVKEVIPALLNAFKTYDIKATFAIVGFLDVSGSELSLPQLYSAKNMIQ